MPRRQAAATARPAREGARLGAHLLTLGCLFMACVSLTPVASAAEITDVLDAFARPSGSNVNASLSVGWEFLQREGVLRREFRCLKDDAQVASLCSDGSQVVEVDEMKVQRLVHVLNVDARLAFWRYAVLKLRVPVILHDQTKLRFASGVTPSNSSVDPANRPSLFDMPYTGAKRSGLGDLVVGVRVTPMNFTREETHPTWAIDVDVTFPTAGVKKGDNDAPGEGLWKVDVSTALSTRVMPWLEPYFKIGGIFRMPASNSLFQDYGGTQTLVSPGHGLNLTLGTEFIPYEDRDRERSFVIDVGASVDFTFEGREYTDLFEALATSPCDPRDANQPCELTTFDRGDVDPATGRRRKTDGITDVEQYATFRWWIGMRYQIIEHLVFQARFALAHETSHYLTTADAGTDLDSSGQVEDTNAFNESEFNPVYADAFDSFGTRFLSADTFVYGVQVSLMGKF